MYETIELTRQAGIARLTLSRPAERNAINGKMCVELAHAAAELQQDHSLKLIVLTGRGEAFSVGGDFVGFLQHRDRLRELILEMTAHLHAAVLSLRRAPAPVLVAVNGVAAGGGFSLVLGADLAIATRSARLVSAYTRSGLTPDGGGTWLLERLVGPQRAFDLMATNPVLSADEALGLGLVSRVVDDAAFAAAVEALATQLAELPANAGVGLKRLFSRLSEQTLEEQMHAESLSLAAAVTSPEALARIEAFVSKKKN